MRSVTYTVDERGCNILLCPYVDLAIAPTIHTFEFTESMQTPPIALPATMKAAVYREYGPPETVFVERIDVPVPAKDELLVRVRAATVNRTDSGFRSAEYFVSRFFSGLLRPKFNVLGNEYSGDVVAVGETVTSARIGDRIFGFNDVRFGAHAEYMIVKDSDTFATIPDGLSYAEAVPITEGAHYALCNLRAAKVKAGQRILINGGTGAIGSAAIQLSKVMGLTVTAVCGPDHVELVRSLGADRVLDYSREDFTALGDRFDVVFDAVGKSTWAKCKPLLTERGIYMSTEFGPWLQNPLFALFTPLTGGKRLLFPLPTINQDDVNYLRDLVATSKFRPLIDRYTTLDDIVETYRYVEKGFKVGNVVVVLDTDG